MAYDIHLAERIQRILREKRVAFFERKMFGGIAFMVDEKMCLGVIKLDLMARVGPDAYAEAVTKNGARPMEFTGRPMAGYLFISAEGVDAEADLEYWVDLCLAYNPQAKASKKRKKK
ncbi:MAG TPA: TfoX family protein [Bacteroidetes bacterium]|nr:TfoX family protein [Bacteroidota bacterium]